LLYRNKKTLQALFARRFKALDTFKKALPKGMKAKHSLTVTKTRNNLFFVLSPFKGPTLFSCGLGALGIKRATKGRSDSFEEYFLALALRLSTLKIFSVVLKTRALRVQEISLLRRCFEKTKVDIPIMIEQTPVIHNGCKIRKTKRL